MKSYDAFSNINSIIERDRTVAPYKYSLLKSVIETCQEYPQYAKFKDDGCRVELPVGICVFKWMIYYYPFFLPDKFISLLGNEKAGRSRIVFRDLFEHVCRFYEQHGGISVFRDDLILGAVPDDIRGTVLKLAGKIRYAIINYPMRHLGFSQTGRHYSVFELEEPAEKIGKSEAFSVQLMFERFGSYSVSSELYSVFRELGGFIIGSGCISQREMDFLKRVNSDTDVTEEDILYRLSIEPVSERDVSDALRVYRKELYDDCCFCVWSGKKLNDLNFAVDHILPFSVWRCNDLWNLMPADSAVNSKKSDKIPMSRFLLARKEEIVKRWSVLSERYPERFCREISVSLLGGRMDSDWMDKAFDMLCEISDYLIDLRGYEGWMPD